MACVLVLAPHPDDEVLGCGGAIARHAAAGDDVHVVVVTRGSPEFCTSAMIEENRMELAAAHAILGVQSVRFLDFPAPKLGSIAAYQLADSIRRAITEIAPSTIYCPHQGDLHGDHKSVYWATLVASRPNGTNRPAKTLCYETLSETEWGAPLCSEVFVPTVFIDISATIRTKLRAWRCYRSQMRPLPHPRSSRCLSALARLRGATAGVRAAEAFMLVREVIV